MARDTESFKKQVLGWGAGVLATVITSTATGAFLFAWNTNEKVARIDERIIAIKEMFQQHLEMSSGYSLNPNAKVAGR